MKKILLFMLVFLFTITKVNANVTLDLNAKSAILIEYDTGKVIYEKNSNEKLNPASMTKIMSLILVMDALEDGKIKLTDEVIVSKEASSMGGSQVYINTGEKYTVDELLKAVSIASANDAIYALAEKVGGTHENFVNMMNDRAKKLNLKNTVFKNSHGLDEEGHYSTASDMSKMAKELIKHEKILDYSSRYEDYFKKKDGSQIWLVNTNKLVKFYEGMDGLKTGYTSSAGYCLTATASRNDLRLISVVMNNDSIEERSQDTMKLLNYGFNTIKKEIIYDSSKVIDKVRIRKSENEEYDVYLKDDIIKIDNINLDKVSFKYKIKYKNNLEAPLKKGSVVGNVTFTLDNKDTYQSDLIVKSDVKKISFIKLLYKNIKKLTSGN